MVHEMNVPFVIRHMRTSAVGSIEAEEPASGAFEGADAHRRRSRRRNLLLSVLVYVFLFWSRRRAKMRPGVKAEVSRPRGCHALSQAAAMCGWWQPSLDSWLRLYRGWRAWPMPEPRRPPAENTECPAGPMEKSFLPSRTESTRTILTTMTAAPIFSRGRGARGSGPSTQPAR